MTDKRKKQGKGFAHEATPEKKDIVRKLSILGRTKKECMEAVGIKNKTSFENHYGEVYMLGKNTMELMTFDVAMKMYENCVTHNKVHAQAIWMKTVGKWFEKKDPGELQAEQYKAFNAINFNALGPGEKAPERADIGSEDHSEEDYTH
jgi:hypothetical protein